ncbi:MAG: hypothetical protein J1F05_06595 [Muribaculaceae bacterium]|nr:hypothetical protein [Muribaculaceae bacterium]
MNDFDKSTVLLPYLVKIRRILPYMACFSVGVWIIAQIVLIVNFWGTPQFSDAANYSEFAHEAWRSGSWYPTAKMFSEYAWIANTGYINFLILNLKFFGTLNLVGIEQLLLNIILLCGFVRLVRIFVGVDVAYVAAILFCLLPSNMMVTPAYMSELLCVSLMVLSFNILKRKYAMVLLSGVLMIIANWVRPIALIFVPALMLYAVINRAKLKYWFAYGLGLAVGLAAIMLFTYSVCGHPLSSSTTKGTNMIIGCWDGATGKYDSVVFEEGNPGYIDPALSYNVVQKDSLLTIRSVEWIKSNPGKFLKLIPSKVAYLWGSDIYADKVLSDKEAQYTQRQRAMGSMVYYAILLLSVCGVWNSRKQLWGSIGVALLPVILGTGMHMLMYGGLRYHYPMMICIIYFAALAFRRALRSPWVDA